MSWSSFESQARRGAWHRRFRILWEITWKATLTLLIPFILLVAWYLSKAQDFDLTEVEKIPAPTVFLDSQGQEIGIARGIKRRPITTDEIPPFFTTCLFAREDARFLEHQGIDYLGLARASLRNLKDFDFTQGASTLSMQLARNTFDLREKKSLNRKFLEIALTYRIEAQYTKPEILTHYLNRIYFGSGCYGIQQAAFTYFDRPTSELTPGQCALLVGIIRAPHTFSPLRNLPAALQQRDEVLDRLIHTQKITPAEAQEIKNAPILLSDTHLSKITHAAHSARRSLEIFLDDTQITTGGLTVTTHIDSTLQAQLESLAQTLPLPENCELAALAVHPQTGKILATLGSRQNPPPAFNRALDAYRDLGPDLISPLIETLALERHQLPLPGNLTATGKLLQPNDAAKLLTRFGFSRPITPGDDLYRGSLAASPLELAIAYATLLNQGSRPTPLFLDSVYQKNTPLVTTNPHLFPAFSPHAIPTNLPSYLAGPSLPKTDYWAVHLHPDLALVLWIGHDQPQRFTLPPSTQSLLKTKLTQLSKRNP